jgi:hypothetical protein
MDCKAWVVSTIVVSVVAVVLLIVVFTTSCETAVDGFVLSEDSCHKTKCRYVRPTSSNNHTRWLEVGSEAKCYVGDNKVSGRLKCEHATSDWHSPGYRRGCCLHETACPASNPDCFPSVEECQADS